MEAKGQGGRGQGSGRLESERQGSGRLRVSETRIRETGIKEAGVREAGARQAGFTQTSLLVGWEKSGHCSLLASLLLPSSRKSSQALGQSRVMSSKAFQVP